MEEHSGTEYASASEMLTHGAHQTHELHARLKSHIRY